MQLPCFIKVFGLMVRIYKRQLTVSDIHHESPKHEGGRKRITLKPLESNGCKINRFNAYFLCVHLGWFFENQSFPRELFISPLTPSRERMDSGGCDYVVDARNGDGIDCHVNLRPSILYTCCPYMSELKVVMSQFHTGFKAPKLLTTNEPNKRSIASVIPNKSFCELGQRMMQDSDDEEEEQTVKRPLTAEETKERFARVQNNLEENFFFNQKASVKHAVEFVTDRIAHNLTKSIKMTIVSSELMAVQWDLKDAIELLQGADEKHRTMCKAEIKLQVGIMGEKAYRSVRAEILKFLHGTAQTTCDMALRPVLPVDTRKDTIDKCINIVVSKVTNKVKDWATKNLTKSFFREELKTAVDNLMSEKTSTTDSMLKCVDGNHLASNPTQEQKEDDSSWAVVQNVKFFSYKVASSQLKDSKKIASQTKHYISAIKSALTSDVLTLSEESSFRAVKYSLPSDAELNGVNKTVNSEFDVTIHGLEMASVELVVSLCAGCPKALDSSLQDEFIALWSSGCGHFNSEKPAGFLMPPQQLFSVLSARNVELLAASKTPTESWNKLEYLIGRLLKHRLILPIVLEDECLQFMKHQWEPEVLQRFGSCLTGITDSYKRESGESFNQEFLDWIAWFIGQVATDELENNLENFPLLM